MKLLWISALVLLIGCQDATGPTEPAQAPVTFMKQGEESGVGGGGGACTKPSSSVQCLIAAWEVAATAGTIAGTGCGGLVPMACAGMLGALYGTSQHYLNTPNCPESWCQIQPYPTIGATQPWNLPGGSR